MVPGPTILTVSGGGSDVKSRKVVAVQPPGVVAVTLKMAGGRKVVLCPVVPFDHEKVAPAAGTALTETGWPAQTGPLTVMPSGCGSS